MKLKLLRLIIMASKLSLYGFAFQFIILSTLWASPGNAQKIESVRNVYIELDLRNADLFESFQLIEAQTDFKFAFDYQDLQRNVKINISKKKLTVADALLKISENANLKFRQVNNQINVNLREPKERPSIEVVIQGRTITGRVLTSEDNSGLPGVNVIVKGTSQGTVTDAEGNYTLEVPDDAILVFSSVGYLQQEILVGNQTVINISLAQDVKSLDEIVVVGYGTQKKVNVTGSVATVSSKDIENLNVTQTSQLLAGQMSGVTITQTSGQPGKDDVRVRVRGIGTFSGAGNDPLVLVDGLASSLDRVDFNDIANISVLKDAASASIYGARGANGVILIETKKGASGKVKVNYNGYVGFQQPSEMLNIVDSWQYALMENEAAKNDGRAPVWSAEEIEKFKSGSDPENYPNARHYDDLISSGSGFQTNHHISLQGGTNSSFYNISLGYLDQKGIIDEASFQRFNLRANTTNKITEKLSLNLILGGRVASSNEPTSLSQNLDLDGIVGYSIKIPNTIPGRLSNGYYGNQTGFTIEGWMDSESYISNDYKDFYSNLSLNWDLTNHLKLTILAGYESNFVNYELYRPVLVVDPFITIEPSELTNRTTLSSLSTQQVFLNYDLPIGLHSIKILGGFSQESFRTDFLQGFRDNFPNNSLYELDAASQANQRASGSGSEWALRSFFGRFTYNHDEKYLFEVNARYDGSSRFAQGNKYGFFPSASAGWRLTEEDFFNVSGIDELKLRASWGKLGNQNIGNYPYQQTFQLGLNTPFGVVESMLPGAAATVVPNNDISWESTRVINYGIDLTLIGGKLNFSVDYFDKLTSGILYNITASSVLGLIPSVQNAGVVSNKGFDFNVMHQNKIGDFQYGLGANFSYVKNTVEELANVEQDIANGLFVGSSLESIYGYEFLGLFVDQAEIDAHATQPRIPQPGDLKFNDISGPNGEPDGIVDATYDRKIIGNRFPKFNFGGTLNLGYKGFDLSMILQGVAGVYQTIGDFYANAFYQGSNPQGWMYENRWTEENPNANAEYPRLSILGGNEEQFYTSTYTMVNASYLRINNLQVGYTFSESFLEAFNLSNLRLYVGVRNLYTFDSFRAGLDPELGMGYPPVRVFTLGINVNF